jgi:predicted XRE-type DNA-binding protein
MWYTNLVIRDPESSALKGGRPEAPERQGKRVPAIFYRTEAGGEPVREWLKGLLAKDRKRIGEDIKTVEFGWPIGMPVCRPLRDGIYEVRTSLGRNRIALHRQERANGSASRIHQENAEDASRRSRPRQKQQSQASEGITMTVRKGRKRVDHSGSTFDSFLEQEGIREEVEAVAIKRVLAWQLEQAMRKQQKTKQAMAKQLHTSRSQLDRLLDPGNVSVTLDTITRAARALGKRVIIRVADAKAAKRA